MQMTLSSIWQHVQNLENALQIRTKQPKSETLHAAQTTTVSSQGTLKNDEQGWDTLVAMICDSWSNLSQLSLSGVGKSAKM